MNYVNEALFLITAEKLLWTNQTTQLCSFPQLNERKRATSMQKNSWTKVIIGLQGQVACPLVLAPQADSHLFGTTEFIAFASRLQDKFAANEYLTY